MNLKTLMLITAVVGIVYGLGFLVAPVMTLSFYGVSTDAAGAYLARFFGATLVSFALVIWSLRSVSEPDAVRLIVWALFVSFALGSVLALWGQLTGLMNAFGWIGVVLFPLIMLGYAYFLFARRGAA